MTDTIFTNETPGTDDLDFITHFFGMEFTVSSACEAVNGRAWVPTAGRPPTFFWQLWRVDTEVMLAEVDLNDAGFGTPASGAFMSFTSANFITPGNVALSTGTSYVEGLFSDDGHFVYTFPASFPVGNGIISSSRGRFRTGGLRTDFPNGTHDAYGFGDIGVDAPVSARPRLLVPTVAVHRAGSW